ncbi:hypothetical protein J658_3507 [Acinetobacter baumannii 573719]|nr:hypothetical protein J658_3507 [Acinetobacter baumannii 573719]
MFSFIKIIKSFYSIHEKLFILLNNLRANFTLCFIENQNK